MCTCTRIHPSIVPEHLIWPQKNPDEYTQDPTLPSMGQKNIRFSPPEKHNLKFWKNYSHTQFCELYPMGPFSDRSDEVDTDPSPDFHGKPVCCSGTLRSNDFNSRLFGQRPYNFYHFVREIPGNKVKYRFRNFFCFGWERACFLYTISCMDDPLHALVQLSRQNTCFNWISEHSNRCRLPK